MANKPKVELKVYRWKGTNTVGRLVSGKFLALGESEVRDRLKSQKIRIQKISSHKVSAIQKRLQQIKTKDITLLTRQLSTMLATGIPLIQALKLVSDNHRKAEMISLLLNLSKNVESGMPLSSALKEAKHFDPLYVDLIATGEATGNLAQVFERIASYREKSERLKAKVIKAMIYPSMVLAVALIVSWGMLTMVIPQFESMFNSFGADLPWFTQQVLNVSYFARDHGPMIAASFAIVFIAIKFARARSYNIRLYFSRLSLRMPIIGSVLSKAAIAKFSRTMATSFGAGIPILSCLKSSAKTTNNCYYQAAIESVHKETAAGMPLYLAMRHSNTFPEMPLQMMMIGEEAGRLDEMLNKVATIYEIEIDDTVDNLGKILEPMIIVLLSVLVGSMVIAIYLPIFNLMNVIG